MKKIRTSKFSKILASYLAIQLIITVIQPNQLFALTGGPSQPEYNSFTPIGTSDMVNLSSGDFNYNIPIMDVGGYPLNLAYDSGITMDQEASWVGLGWNLNIGQINRHVRGIPDDFNGDDMIYENNLKKNKTVGLTLSINGQLSGSEFGFGGNASATLMHNNYEGFSFSPSLGVSYKFSSGTSVGMNLSSSVGDGISITPSASQSYDTKKQEIDDITTNSISNTTGAGVTYNSRQGITAFNINTSTSDKITKKGANEDGSDNVTYNNKKSHSSTISFIDNTFTPYKRTAYNNQNFTFRATLGPDAWPFSFEVGAAAFYTIQSLDEKVTTEKAFGYEFTKNASINDILDFNRENERMISKNTRILPTVNYTYDIYNIQGQGIGGQYRPFKSQVGYVYNPNVNDKGNSFSFGAEIEGGAGFHVGVDIQYSPTTSSTGVWNVPVLNKFKNSSSNKIDYEETYFKAVGDLSIDEDEELYENALSGESPMALDLSPDGKVYGKKAVSKFNVKNYTSEEEINYTSKTISSYLKRSERDKRNQAISKVTKQEAAFDPFVKQNINLKNHHTNGVKVVESDGSTYIYGEAVVNKTKQEVSFATNASANPNTIKNGTTLVNGQDNIDNSSGVDNYFNKITTPNYAHTYLLTSVLSTDYEDLTGNGTSDDDLGAYTKFYYDNNSANSNDYQWRVPLSDASYNPGLYTKTNDQKASYIYGVKEIKYVSKIETKTHVAIFDLVTRDDGKGVGSALLYRIKSIRLYSKPEYLANQVLLSDNNPANDPVSPIKTAFFEYDYSLCENLPNNIDYNPVNNTGPGKLTLTKLYFTYRDSKMGKYTPYVFQYQNPNPKYQLKSYDVWGNYKPLFEEGVFTVDTNNDGIQNDFSLPSTNFPNTSCEINYPITAQEFPFVKQNNKELNDLYAAAWTLSAIELPSGGNIELQYESDDYKYVQDREAMQMFKVVGVNNDGSNQWNNELFSNSLGNGGDAKYLVVELLEDVEDAAEFEEKYLGEYIDKPLFFRFLLNMMKNGECGYDYVEGYCEIDQDLPFQYYENLNGGSKSYGAIPIKYVDLEGGINGQANVNPISKAGWYFARQYLNSYAYGTGDNSPTSINIGEIVNAIGAHLPLLTEIFIGPNDYLRKRSIAKKFKPEKSWIRLKHPTNAKLGGGLRVKKIIMHDNWDNMVGFTQSNPINSYSNFYGQEYKYATENNVSSGVATWEPNMSKENPFVEPMYDNKERLSAHTYVEKPFGVSFFPSPVVTYSRVEVKNLPRFNEDTHEIVKKHATGKIIYEFFTSNDFPTIADFTEIEDKNNYISNESNILDNLLRLNVLTELSLSQGFSVITNDMNGKTWRQKVIDEYGNPVSEIEYKYNVEDATGRLRLKNKLPVIMPDGTLNQEGRNIGIHYDVITDFNENYNLTEVYGIDTNATFFIIPIGIIPIPILLGQLPFEYKRNESTLHTTTTTKVIHQSGILKEKIATDLGSKVSTKNLAWDAISGQVLLTETTNEYDNNIGGANYFNFSYPAHWAYPGMSQAYKNLDLVCWLTPQIANSNGDAAGDVSDATSWYTLKDYPSTTLKNYFAPGDEIYVYGSNGSVANKYWISEISADGNAFMLIDRAGNFANPCGENEEDLLIKIVRSHNRNLQNASMASITSMTNLVANGSISSQSFQYSGSGVDPKIINASSVEYSDFWKSQKENNLNVYAGESGILQFPSYSSNPFVNNVKGDWRAVKSYAFLTGRVSLGSPRSDGFFTSFRPYYKYNGSIWVKDGQEWTYASEVTKYSPYGAELENKDALDRYSAAQYGYGYTLPIAVASNSEYREIGFDGFEDYNFALLNQTPVNIQGNSHLSPHFSFVTVSENTANTRTPETSHTGNYSLQVKPNSKVAFIMEYEGKGKCNIVVNELDCSPEGLPNIPGCGGLTVWSAINAGTNSVTVFEEDLGIPYMGTTIIWDPTQCWYPNEDTLEFIENNEGNITIRYTRAIHPTPYEHEGGYCNILFTLQREGFGDCIREIELTYIPYSRNN